MPNTFPLSGPVGIGTDTPDSDKLLTMDSGSETVDARARIRGRSPTWIFGGSTSPYTGGEAFIGLVTVAGDYVPGSGVGDAFFFHGSNSNRIFIGRTTVNNVSVPLMTVHNTSANVAIGLGVADPGGRLVAAGPITGGTGSVQLQGNNASVGIATVAIGYRGPYNTYEMTDSGYVQVERQGTGYYPLRLQPLGGVVYVGFINPLSPQPPDRDFNGHESIHRFRVVQEINNVAVTDTPGNKFHVMASFEMVSSIPHGSGTPGNDTGCGRFFIRQTSGGAWIRALEAQAIRNTDATNHRTWGLEVGVHNAKRDADPHVSVGIYIHAANPGLVPNPQKCNTGILIDGRPGGDGDGWDDFIRCRSGSLGTSTTPKFWVGGAGNVWAKSNIEGNGNLLITGTITGQSNLDITGDILGRADIGAFNTVSAGAEMYATAFICTSSQSLKENIVPIDTAEAMAWLPQLTPVKYNLKARPDRQLMGFVMENVPAPFAVDGRGVNVTAVVATLAAVVRAQQQTLDLLQARVDDLERGAAP